MVNRWRAADLAVDGQIDLAVSTEIVAETLRVLGQKFDRGSEWLTEADRQLRVIASIVAPAETIQAIEADPTDDRILECAVACRCGGHRERRRASSNP